MKSNRSDQDLANAGALFLRSTDQSMTGQSSSQTTGDPAARVAFSTAGQCLAGNGTSVKKYLLTLRTSSNPIALASAVWPPSTLAARRSASLAGDSIAASGAELGDVMVSIPPTLRDVEISVNEKRSRPPKTLNNPGMGIEEMGPQKVLGRRLRAARERVGLTQQAVGDHFDVGDGTVSAWEVGRTDPGALRVAALARLYETSADALLGDTVDADPRHSLLASQIAAAVDKLDSIELRMRVYAIVTRIVEHGLWPAFDDERLPRGTRAPANQPRHKP